MSPTYEMHTINENKHCSHIHNDCISKQFCLSVGCIDCFIIWILMRSHFPAVCISIHMAGALAHRHILFFAQILLIHFIKCDLHLAGTLFIHWCLYLTRCHAVEMWMFVLCLVCTSFMYYDFHFSFPFTMEHWISMNANAANRNGMIHTQGISIKHGVKLTLILIYV